MRALWNRIAELAVTKKMRLPSGQVMDTNRAVSVTSAAIVLNRDDHGEKPIILNRAGGIAATLPASNGSGARFEIIVGTTFTGAATIKVANATDVYAGRVLQTSDAGNALVVYDTSATDDTITLDGSTTGGLIGDRFVFVDVRAGFWALDGFTSATGTEATSLSATV